MNYSDEIDTIVRRELDVLIDMYKSKKGPFNKEYLMKYYEKYEKSKKSWKKAFKNLKVCYNGLDKWKRAWN